MRRPDVSFRAMPVAALLLAAALAGGCNTYHYFDIQVTAASPVTEIETSSMVLQQIVVSGADSANFVVQNSPAGFPALGTFEYSTFTDSGQLTFTYNGYQTNVDPNLICTTGSVPMTASSEITQMGMITVTSFDQTKCPPHVTP